MTKALYLDNAATSFPKPEAVYTAVDHYQRHLGAAFARGTRGQEQADSVVARCRRELSRLIDAKDDRCIAFTYNATDGLNLLLRGILRSNQRVVTTTLEHNSVLRPLHQLKEQRSLLVDFVPFDIATGELDLQQFSVLLHEHPTDWVVLNLVSNVTGIVQPLLQISDLVRNAGARLLVDASQAVGHVPVSVKDAGIHLLAAAGHKALVGPLGTGFVYVAPELHDELVSNRCGGTGTRSSEPEQPRTMPELLESIPPPTQHSRRLRPSVVQVQLLLESSPKRKNGNLVMQNPQHRELQKWFNQFWKVNGSVVCSVRIGASVR